MKFNIAYPATGAQKTIEIDDERKIRAVIDKRLASEIEGEALGQEFKGYVFKITGGCDKQGFPMKQGVLVPGRVRLLLSGSTGCYRPHRDGERRRKSVRGCIVSNEIAVVNMVVVKKGDEELPGVTDKYIPRRLGPKRASKIRKLFNLSKEDDVRKYVIRRELAKEGKNGKKRTKAPKIQRLVTPITLQRRRHRLALKRRRAEKAKADAAEYAKLLAQRAKERRQSALASRRSQRQSVNVAAAATTTATAADKGAAKPAAGKPKEAAAKAAAKAAPAPAKAAAKPKKAAAKAAAKAAPAPAKAAAKPKEATATKPAEKAAPKPAAKPAPKVAAAAKPAPKEPAAKPAAKEVKPSAAKPAGKSGKKK